MMRFKARILSVLGAAALCAASGSAFGQCATYSVGVLSPNPAFIPGVDDTGNHVDDTPTTAISFPFFVSFYGTDYAGAQVSSNGNLQFTTNTTAYTNTCLPTATISGPTIFLMWDDLYTAGTAAGQGIFTTTVGTAPNRQFVVEWRVQDCCSTAAPIHNFEVIFYEGANFFDVLYQTVAASGTDSTVGVQAGSAGPSTQFSCSTGTGTLPASGMALRYTCQVVEPNVGCCDTTGACSLVLQSQCVAPGVPVGSTCSPNPCTALVGACCDTVGVCSATTAQGCVTPNTFTSAGTTCSPTACNSLLGGCCFSGQCSVTTARGCPAPSTYLGAGTICNPNPCPIPPPNDLCQNATPAVIGANSGTIVEATSDGVPACGNGGGGRDVYYTFTPAATGAYQFENCGDVGFDTVISVHTGCPVTAANQVAGACNDDGCGATFGPSTFTTTLNGGTQYIIRMGGYSANTVSQAFTFNINVIGSGACCNNTTGACTITASSGCSATTSNYQGDNTVCSPSPCPPTNPSGTGTFAPNPVPELTTATLFVTVTPGANPPSTGLSVLVDTSPISATLQTVLHDDGIAPDVTAGDNRFSGSVLTNAAAGTYGLGVSISDAQNRIGSATINLVIAGVPGGCCSGGSCTITTGQVACTSGGGTYLGAGTSCGGPWYTQGSNAHTFSPIAGLGTALAGAGNCDDCVETISLPFFYSYLGTSFTDVTVSSNGYIEFGGNISSLANVPIPNGGTPNNIIAAMWDDLNPLSAGDIYTLLQGTSPNQTFTISWEGVPQFAQTDNNNFQIVLHENGDFELLYGAVTAEATSGDYTVGFENADGSAGVNVGGGALGSGNVAFNFTSTTIADPCSVSASGACCCGSSCSLTTAAACSGSGMSFAGGGTACNVSGNFSTPCCKGDYNKTGGQPTVQDIFDFLTGYFTTNPCADTNSSGTVSVQDIFDFLSAYFGGC